MKTTIYQSITSHCNKAIEHYKCAMIHLKRMSAIICMLFLFCNLPAQSLKSLNCIDLKYDQTVLKFAAMQIQKTGMSKESYRSLVVYKDVTFGVILLYFSTNKVCYKQEFMLDNNMYQMIPDEKFEGCVKTVTKYAHVFRLSFSKI